MPFNRIAFYLSSSSKVMTRRLNTAGIELLYSQFLKGPSFQGASNINIYLTCAFNESNKLERFGSFISYYKFFDFDKLDELPNDFQKKKLFLDAIQESIITICKAENWDKNRFVKAYEACIALGLLVEWNFKHKLFPSPNKEYYFALLNAVDFEGFKIYEVLYDKNKVEIFRRICFQDIAPVFIICNACWSGDSKNFIYSFCGPKKEFSANISELLSKTAYSSSRQREKLF